MVLWDFAQVGLFLGIGGAVLYAISIVMDEKSWLRRYLEKNEKPWIEVGQVTELFVHPIKSCRGIEVSQAECTKLGLVNSDLKDRHFMLINEKDKSYMTARDYPKMVLVTPRIKGNYLTLTAPTMDTCVIDLEKVVEKDDLHLWSKHPIEGYDCGDQVAQWFQQLLQISLNCRLVYYVHGLLNERRTSNDPHIMRRDHIVYHDLAPYELVTEASLADLNTWITNEDVSMRNFRSNIVVTGNKAYDEDNWEEIKIGSEVEFSNILPCSRCILSTVNPDKGEKSMDMEPLKSLKRYRLAPSEKRHIYGNKPFFGINLVINSSGSISVGDKVFVHYKK